MSEKKEQIDDSQLKVFDVDSIKDYSTILFVGKRRTGMSISVSDYLYHHHVDLPHVTSLLDDKGSSNMCFTHNQSK